MKHPCREELEAGLAHIRAAPAEQGVLEMIVRRPAVEQRELLSEARLDSVAGLVGDNWQTRGSRRTADGAAHPEMQLNLMNARVTDLVAGSRDRWPLAGDQLYVDLDLSEINLPPGSRLQVGSAIIEVTAVPHLGCKKFMARFGRDTMEFVNSDLGKQLHLRGINTKVIQAGVASVGDRVVKLENPALSAGG